jgi:hypothetical protein
MKSVWRSFLRGWKAFWSPVGKFQTLLILSVIYWVVLPIFSLVRFKDPLRKRREGDSFWTARRPLELDVDRQHLPF